jgi:uncharacterized coiled-coil protein SlyX
MGAIQKHDRIAKLSEQLAAADARSRELNAELAKLQRKVDNSEHRARELREEIARCQIEGWGNKPDWQAMLRGDTMAMHYALEAHLAKIGLHMGYSWSDVKERIITISIDSGEIGAVARNAAAISLLMPHMRSHTGGAVWFSIAHSDMSNSAWTLRINRKKLKYELVQEVHSSVEKRLPFPTLEAALAHVQDKLWSEDILDAQPVALLETTIDLT